VPHLRDGFIVDKVGLFSRQRKSHAILEGIATVSELVRPKIKSEKVENFQRSNKRHFRTKIHHTITTNPPANYHQKTHDFPRTPLKNTSKTAKNHTPAPQNFFCQIRTQKTSPRQE
jgi:hypothetical protein